MKKVLSDILGRPLEKDIARRVLYYVKNKDEDTVVYRIGKDPIDKYPFSVNSDYNVTHRIMYIYDNDKDVQASRLFQITEDNGKIAYVEILGIPQKKILPQSKILARKSLEDISEELLAKIDTGKKKKAVFRTREKNSSMNKIELRAGNPQFRKTG